MGGVIWITGLPGSGKTAIARAICDMLKNVGEKVEILDGDEIRRLISSELGFSKEDRILHNKRVIYIANLLSRNGVWAIISLISPYKEVRELARKTFPNYLEVYIECPIEYCAARNWRGLFEKAFKGEIKGLTGYDAPYEPPENPDVVVYADKELPEEGAQKIFQKLVEKGWVSPYKPEEEEEIKKHLSDLGYLG